MKKYLITYHNGGPMPNDPKAAEQMKMAFGKWLQEAGNAIVDPGAPVMKVNQVAAGTPAQAVEVGGYSIIQAENEEVAHRVLKSHPFVARGGTLQVNQVMGV
jgi:hypothetical protein